MKLDRWKSDRLDECSLYIITQKPLDTAEWFLFGILESMKRHMWFFVVVLCVILLFVFVPKHDVVAPGTLRIGDAVIVLEIADSQTERVQGLSGRETLDPSTGLLFVFEKPEKIGIWMKDMLFPIDIIWINEQKKIIDIKTNVTPDSYPQAFFPKEKSLYVLEVNAGFVEKNAVRIGDAVMF